MNYNQNIPFQWTYTFSRNVSPKHKALAGSAVEKLGTTRQAQSCTITSEALGRLRGQFFGPKSWEDRSGQQCETCVKMKMKEK